MSPTRLLLQGALVWLAIGVVASFIPALQTLWMALGLVALFVVAVDANALYRKPPPAVQRQLSSALPLGEWINVDMRLHNLGSQPLTVELFDHVPDSFEHQQLPQRVQAPGQGWVQLNYRVRATQRGDFSWLGCFVWRHSGLGLWRRHIYISSLSDVRVYPNFEEVTRYHLLAAERRAVSLGIRRLRRRGEGQDFHQLREYRAGDALRQIDWKATARNHRLISKDYQEERDQQIVFMLDAGRKMRTIDDTLSHFDHALNAILLLSYVSLKQGDAVGFYAFGGDSPRWLAPSKGVSTVNQVLNTVYNLQTTPLAADYLQAATELSSRLSKRALVVLITNLRDEDLDDVVPALHLLRERHLPLVVSLREHSLDEALNAPVTQFSHAVTHAALCQYLSHRQAAHQRLRDNGMRCLDVTPQMLASQLVNAYYDIKFSGRL